MGTITQKTFHQSTSDLFFFPHHKTQPPHLQHPKKSAVIQVLCEMKQFVIIASLLAAAAATPDLLIHRGGESPLHGHEHAHNNRLAQSVLGRQGRQAGGAVTGGVDFSNCQTDPDTGLCCVEKEETVTSLQKDPILECTHKNVEKSHYTYVTQFTPAQEEVCEENFEKTCQITFKQMAVEENVKKCYKPIEKVCNGQGPEECRTVYESSCTTKYVEKQPGKFVGDTKCEKLPIEICGAGCVTEEGPEECHDKTVTSLVDVPEEVCDLNPQKICKFQTKLVPKLKPAHECTIIPKETCHLKFDTPKQVDKDLKTKWCLDDTPPEPAETYEEDGALAEPLGTAQSQPVASYLPANTPFAPAPQIPDDALPAYGAPQAQYQGRKRL